jgi:hypothetical protein
MLAVLLVSSAARADNILAGQVVSIDQKRGIMIVRTPQAGEAPAKGRPGREITVVTGGRSFPAGLRAGMPVRLQGAFEKGSAVFKALTIQADSPDRFRNDPTGVRRRLGKKELHRKDGSRDVLQGMQEGNRGHHGH